MVRGTTIDIRRGRALALGLLLLALDGGAVLVALRGAADSWRHLDRLPAAAPVEAVPTVARSALAGALVWAAILLVIALWRLVERAPTPTSPSERTLAHRVATVLLAVAAIGSAHGAATAAPATTLTATVTAATTPDPPRAVAPRSAPDPSFAPHECSSAPVPGWTPEAPAPPDQRAADCAPLVTGGTHSGDDTVTVRRGDTLWSLVARHLGSDADPATIAAVWPRWYAANRALIGDDPNLLRPGQQLRIPATEDPA